MRILATISTFMLMICANTFIAAQALPSFNKWEQKDFAKQSEIEYEQNVLKISSTQSSSGLFLEKTIDLNKTPILSWDWKISNTLEITNEKSKKGDDFSARVYILVSTGPLPWQKHSLSYVWSNYQEIGAMWPNPYTENVMMLAVDSTDSKQNQWQSHQRNMQQDLLAAFGKKYDEIEVIAVMTDTDNSQQSATGWYRNLTFSAAASGNTP